MSSRRLLLVHAHPDDETVGTGATMARYAAEGASVTLVTCTLGEEGEVRLPLYAELAADRADQLGGYRIAELAEACRALGVRDHRFLGGPGRYRDSGMMGLPTNDNPRSFWQADLDEAAGRLVGIIREVRPQVVVTYDPNGFYGHPDHIQAHRVAMRGVELAADPAAFPEHGPAWSVAKVYWTAVPKSALKAGLEQFASSAENPFGGVTDVADLPFGTPDEDVAAEIDGRAYADRKLAAMRAHPTQIAADDWLFTLARLGGDEALGLEHYVLAVGERGTSDGREDDLFAGVDCV
jgi:N-acetyl-1-D-myo-inositol-2-amino-2-deoxy-alpha-D-glucopyranoside deacetylase